MGRLQYNQSYKPTPVLTVDGFLAPPRKRNRPKPIPSTTSGIPIVELQKPATAFSQTTEPSFPAASPVIASTNSTTQNLPLSIKATATTMRSHTYTKLTRAAVIQFGIKATFVMAVLFSPLESIDKACLGYATFALLFSIDNRISFTMALVSLVDVPIFSTLGHGGGANIMAIAAFYFLTTGTVQAILDFAQTTSPLGKKEPCGSITTQQ